jgi:RNA polymerase sigma-70 factor (ECF subfamily)
LKELEKSVIERWKNGDREAFAQIVQFYMADAYMTALGLVGNEEDAKDLSQDAFLKVFESRKSFDAEKPFYPWFYRILKNHCINYIRRFIKRRTGLCYPDQPDSERFASELPTPFEKLEQKERRKILRAAVNGLSFDHREIIILKNFQGYSYKEIAEILQIPVGTVMSRLYYARKMLKELIKEIEQNGLPADERILVERSPSPGEVV